MAKRSLNLCCSESSDALCTPWNNVNPSFKLQHSVRPDLAPRLESSEGLLSDGKGIREELEMLLLREQGGPVLWNYVPQHNFLTPACRQVLVAHLSSVSYLRLD